MWEQVKERPGARLRALMATQRPLLIPGAYDALSAMILERLGFLAVCLPSLGTALSLIGLPDAGLTTGTETALATRYVADAVRIPVISDAENGYGNAINVMRTVRDHVAAGAAGLWLDDQVAPAL